ncbi:MAG: phosphatidate cytidylyltransferase [Rhodoferax sp.]
MLKQRVITALVLLALLLPTLFAADVRPFMGLTLLLIAAAAWEWARLNHLNDWAAVASGLGCGLACLGLWFGGMAQTTTPTLWWGCALLWPVLLVVLLRGGVEAWTLWPRALRLVGGWVAMSLAWLAVAQARALGVHFLLSALSLVWVADIGAYFVGRAVGGRWVDRKLAPRISPGKSWEGAVGGALAVLVLGAFWQALETNLGWSQPSLYKRLWDHGPAMFAVALLGLCAISVAGDLVESLVKRSAGVKDSSALLPGHGGVLDRIDAIIPTIPLVLFLVSLSTRE